MDNLTHTLAGAALGEAGLKRTTALAMPTLLIGANLPDIDVIAILYGHGLDFRRGWTHGMLALFALPLVLFAIMFAWDRWIGRRRREAKRRPGTPEPPEFRPKQILFLSYLAVFSHPVLDWLNTYGMRWLMPFDGTWFYGDALFIVDPWLWLALGIGVMKSRELERPIIGVAAVTFGLLYGSVMVWSASYGREWVAEGARRQGIVPGDVMVGPVPLNPFRRQIVVVEGDHYWLGELEFSPRPRFRLDAEPIPSNMYHPAAWLAAAEPEGERFLTWSRFPFLVVTPLGDSVRVRLDDMRYSTRRRASFAAVQLTFPSEALPDVLGDP